MIVTKYYRVEDAIKELGADYFKEMPVLMVAKISRAKVWFIEKTELHYGFINEEGVLELRMPDNDVIKADYYELVDCRLLKTLTEGVKDIVQLYFTNKGVHIEGARQLSLDPNCKYLFVRRCL